MPESETIDVTRNGHLNGYQHGLGSKSVFEFEIESDGRWAKFRNRNPNRRRLRPFNHRQSPLTNGQRRMLTVKRSKRKAKRQTQHAPRRATAQTRRRRSQHLRVSATYNSPT